MLISSRNIVYFLLALAVRVGKARLIDNVIVREN